MGGLTDLKEQVYCLKRQSHLCVRQSSRDFSHKSNTDTNTEQTAGVSPVTLTYDYPCKQQTKSLKSVVEKANIICTEKHLV